MLSQNEESQNDTTSNNEISVADLGAMCQMPEIENKICDGTSMITQGHQMITCNDACGNKANITIPLQRIDEVTYCLKSKTCWQAIKDYCNGLLDTKINQWPRTVQVIKPVSCNEEENTNNDDEFDDSLWWNNIPDPAWELEQWTQWSYTFTSNDYSCCSATINAEKPLWQAVETYSFTCNSECKNPWRTIDFNQKFKADNNCDSLESCQWAIASACNYCGVKFDGEAIDIDSTYDPLRPEIGKTVADYIAENITRMNQIAGLFKTADKTGTYTISNGVKQLIWEETYAKIFGSGKMVAKLDEFWKPMFDKDWKEILIPEWSILGEIAEYWQYAMLAIDLINGDYTKFAQSAVNLVLTALGSPITLDIQWFLDNPVTAYIKMWLQALNLVVPGLWTAAAFIFDMLQTIPAVGNFFDDLWEWVKKARRSVQRFFWYTPRTKTFTCDWSCGVKYAWKEITLKDLEEKTGCAGAGNCADEAFSFCQWHELVHKSMLIENCHNCETKIYNADGNELIPGERERDHFMNMQYQCSGEWCGEEPWVMISAEKLHSMYNCDEKKLKEQCREEWRENKNECFQACIEESSQKYCMGMWWDFVATDACNAIYDPSETLALDFIDDYECSKNCWLREWTEIKKKDIQDKYKCTTEAACQYYATIECINPWHAKNKEESAKLAESQWFCIAVFDHNGVSRDSFTCASACVKANKEIKIRDLEKEHSCEWKWCQEYANTRCGGDRVESSCKLTTSSWWYSCEFWCKKAPNTIITKSHLETNYNCQWDACTWLAQQFCEDTLPEPACNVGTRWENDILVADHYVCGAGCQKPENLQVMKRDLAKQLWCNEDGREWCRQTAIDYCDNKHPDISISDKSRIGVIVDKAGEYIAAASVVAWWLQTVFDGLWWLWITIPTRATQTLKVVQQVSSIHGQTLGIVNQIYQVVTSDRWNRDEVIKNLYIIENFEWTIEQYIKTYKDITFKADENAIEWTCALWAWWVDVDENGRLKPWTKEKIWFLWKIVNGMVVITQVFAPDAMKNLTDTLNPFWPWWWNWWPWWSTNPYVNAWVVPYWATCPELEEIIANTSWPLHSAPPLLWYDIKFPGSCNLKATLLEAYCENKLPSVYKARVSNDIVQLVRIDIKEEDLVCSDPFRRDCNPFVEGDEFLIEIYEPVIVPNNDPVKAPWNCRDGIQNNWETGLDCGEVCGTCCDGSRLWCREKIPGSVIIDCGAMYDQSECMNAWCEWKTEYDPYDPRIVDSYCTWEWWVCNFWDKASCSTDTNCLRWCQSDLPKSPWN